MDHNYWDYGDIPIDGRITLHIAILYCIEMDPQKRVMAIVVAPSFLAFGPPKNLGDSIWRFCHFHFFGISR